MVRNISAAADKIRVGALSPVALLERCLERVDQYEAKVRAWVIVDREGVKRQAEQAACEIRSGTYRGPLHGIPIGIKDIIDVADLTTAAGFRPWAQSIARRDATVVERLRQAGAVIMGKLVTTQFASFDPPPTRNPRNTERTPGGSSSGSAAAVATGMCMAALGTQTGGSITRPASYCGVAACKPTYGRVSVNGVVPLAHSMDHIGPMANRVGDLALVLQVIAGHDPRDPESSRRAVRNYLPRSNDEIPPPRLARVRGPFEDLADPMVREAVDQSCARLVAAGAHICERSLPASFAEVIPCHRTVMAVEAAEFHRQRFERMPEEYGPRISALIREGLACPAPEYARCKGHQRELSTAIRHCVAGVDALIIPATTSPAPGIQTTGDPAFNSPWSYTGLPVVSFPIAWTPDQLPIAIQLVAPRWREAELFRAAAWCEATIGLESRDPPL